MSETSALIDLSKTLESEQRGGLFGQHRPDTIALDVAENILLLDELQNLLEPPIRLTRTDLNYPHDSIGSPQVRHAIATLLSSTWKLAGANHLSAENVLCTPGASAALHLHARARLKPDDSIIAPAPYWQMFDRIYRQAGVTIEPLPIGPQATTSVDRAALEASYQALLARGKRPRMLLLTNPHNPLGLVESRESLEGLFDWVLGSTDMEIVSDEIYAHSLFDPAASFSSALSLPASLEHPERVHVIWGFAKDFGLSGWMAGVLLTRSGALHEKIRSTYARLSPFDGLKDRVFKRLLCERNGEQSAEELLAQLADRLPRAHARVAGALAAAGITHAEAARGAPFFWLDLGGYLDRDIDHAPHPAECLLEEPDRPGLDLREGRLHRYLACAAGVVLLRGQVMHAGSPGFFRLCFTAEPVERVVDAVERMGAALQRL